jgi:uncharacterized protein YdaU (DUF1376 family)
MSANAEKPDAWMPLYVGDYLRDTGDLSLEEHGAYTKLLMHMWGREGRLPMDHVRLARLCQTDPDTWARVWPAIERFFEVSPDRAWISQRRLLRELEKARRRRADAVEAGRRGAQRRKDLAAERQSATLPATPQGTLPAPLPATPQAEPEQPERRSSSSPSPSPSPSPASSSPPASSAHAPARDPRTTGSDAGRVHGVDAHVAEMQRIVEEPGAHEVSTSAQIRPYSTTGWDPQRVLSTFGRLRSDMLPGTLPWTASGGRLWEKVRPICLAIEDDPTIGDDVEPTMRMALERARDSQDPRDQEAAWGFSAWAARFTDLREELRGLRRRREPGAEPCSFHRDRRNDGKPAPRHLFSATCPECRHVTARASPRAASAPSSAAEVFAATNRR